MIVVRCTIWWLGWDCSEAKSNYQALSVLARIYCTTKIRSSVGVVCGDTVHVSFVSCRGCDFDLRRCQAGPLIACICCSDVPHTSQSS